MDERLPLLAVRRARAGSRVAALRWWPDEAAPGLAPAISDCVIPRLRITGRLRP